MEEHATDNLGCTTAPGLVDALAASIGNVEHIASEIEHLHRLALLGVLSAGLAHEINNILTPVIAYSHAALSDNTDHRLRAKALRKALQGAQDVAEIVTATLGIASRSVPGHESASVLNAARDARASLGRNPARDGMTIHQQVDADITASISPIALRQVLLNLLLNARNAMAGRDGHIDVTASRQGGIVTITVADDGPGIPEELRDTLFDPFVTSCTKSCYSSSTGVGLGLSVCRMLIENAGGTITFDTETGRGTRFEIELPAAVAQPREAA